MRSFIPKLFFTSAICACMAVLCILHVACITPVMPDSISAKSAVLIDASDGDVIIEKNAYNRMPMASTTKIMTAIVALESCDCDAQAEISPLAVGVEGSSVYLRAGEHLSIRALLSALMLESANDAATAIAIAVAGSEGKFVDMMNEKAEELGLRNTHFANPHGLDNQEHYTTAYELALLSAYGLRNNEFRKIVSTRKETIPLHDDEGVRLLVNHNKMLRMYDGAIGVKTGFTKHSGRCLVSAAERDGLTLVAVTLNAPDDWNDHKTMLDYGFDMFEAVPLASPGLYLEPLSVQNGIDDCVMVTNTDSLSVTLPKEHGEISCRVELPRFIFAPVQAGDQVGRLVWSCDGGEIASLPLTVCYSVQKREKPKGFFGKLFG